MAVRVLIVDDHALVREGLRLILEAAPDIDVVDEAAEGREAVRLAGQLHPDVVIMDLAMQGLNGIEATAQICRAEPDCRVVILSMYDSSEHVHRALRAGARGYVLKSSAGAELVSAVLTVAGGGLYLSSRIPAATREAALASGEPAGGPSPMERLSQREREVVQLVVEGHSSADVAHILGLSPKTVDTYRSRAMAKLGVRDLAGLVRFAVTHGLTPDG